MPDTLIATTPIGVRIDAAPPMARLLLRGDPAALGRRIQLDLPTTPCTAAAGVRSALWLGPDEWLVLAPAATGWTEWDDEHGAAIDIGHRQIAFTVTGEQAATVLAVGCPLDLDRSVFPAGSCTRTVFGKAEIVLWRREPHVFHIEVWRSFAAYVGGLLAEGASDIAT